MSDKVAGAAAAETQEAPVKAPKFPTEKLRASCLEVLGVTTSTFDAAVLGLKGDKFTVEEMRKHIEKWQSQPVMPTKKEVK